MRGTNRALITLAACTAFLAAAAATAQAASYKKLKSRGYTTGQLTRSTAGTHGWIVTGKGKRYFCKLDATIIAVSRTELVSLLASGRQIPIDRRVYMKSLGNKKVRIPKMSDLKAGRPDPRDVGRCVPLK